MAVNARKILKYFKLLNCPGSVPPHYSNDLFMIITIYICF